MSCETVLGNTEIRAESNMGIGHEKCADYKSGLILIILIHKCITAKNNNEQDYEVNAM